MRKKPDWHTKRTQEMLKKLSKDVSAVQRDSSKSSATLKQHKEILTKLATLQKDLRQMSSGVDELLEELKRDRLPELQQEEPTIDVVETVKKIIDEGESNMEKKGPEELEQEIKKATPVLKQERPRLPEVL